MPLKTSLSQLALSGGAPAFAEPLHVGRPNVGDVERLLGEFRAILDRRWFTNDGPCVRELEQEIAKYLGVKHCIAVSNGTLGLELVISALDLQGEVIVPSFTFVATAHSVRWMGQTPVFADVTPTRHSLDPEHVERLITPRTRAILGVHLWGVPCDVVALQQLARRSNLKLIFDAAHAFGCSTQGKKVGNFGDAEVFSFHATKFFNTFEGGAITTNDDALAFACRRSRNFGFEGYDNVTSVGTNAKMTEVCAAMGLESLRSIDKFVATNRRNHERYMRRCAEISGLAVLDYARDTDPNYQYIVVSVDERKAGLTRDELVRVLHTENVLARRYFAPGTHRMRAYAERHGAADLPVTNHLANSVLCLPTGSGVLDQDIDGICHILELAVRESKAVRSLLQSAP